MPVPAPPSTPALRSPRRRRGRSSTRADFRQPQDRASTTRSGPLSSPATRSSTRTCPPATRRTGFQTIGTRIFVTYAQQNPALPADARSPGRREGLRQRLRLRPARCLAPGRHRRRAQRAAGSPRQAPVRTTAASPRRPADRQLRRRPHQRVPRERPADTWTPERHAQGARRQSALHRRTMGDPVRQRRRQQRPAQPPVLHRRAQRRDRRSLRPDHPEPGPRPAASVPATLSLTLGAPATLRRVHARRRTSDYTGLDHGQRDLHARATRRSRSPTRARPAPASSSTARSRWPSRCRPPRPARPAPPRQGARSAAPPLRRPC